MMAISGFMRVLPYTMQSYYGTYPVVIVWRAFRLSVEFRGRLDLKGGCQIIDPDANKYR